MKIIIQKDSASGPWKGAAKISAEGDTVAVFSKGNLMLLITPETTNDPYVMKQDTGFGYGRNEETIQKIEDENLARIEDLLVNIRTGIEAGRQARANYATQHPPLTNWQPPSSVTYAQPPEKPAAKVPAKRGRKLKPTPQLEEEEEKDLPEDGEDD